MSAESRQRAVNSGAWIASSGQWTVNGRRRTVGARTERPQICTAPLSYAAPVGAIVKSPADPHRTETTRRTVVSHRRGRRPRRPVRRRRYPIRSACGTPQRAAGTHHARRAHHLRSKHHSAQPNIIKSRSRVRTPHLVQQCRGGACPSRGKTDGDRPPYGGADRLAAAAIPRCFC